jgi:plastocyanin
LKHWLLLLMAAALFSVVAACGDDDDDGGGDELTEEEYFTRMDAIDKELDPLFNSEAGETAGDVLDSFQSAVDTAQERYGDVSPPADLEDEHNALVDAVDQFDEALGNASEDVDREAEPDAFFVVFEDPDLGEADGEITTAYCAIQDAADAAGVEADVGCDDGGDDAVDPGTLPTELTTENQIIEFAFTPPHMQVSVGDTVTWTNQDEAPHDVTADDGSFETDTLNQGDTGEVTFEEAGTFSYFCSIHPDMLGAVTVVE